MRPIRYIHLAECVPLLVKDGKDEHVPAICRKKLADGTRCGAKRVCVSCGGAVCTHSIRTIHGRHYGSVTTGMFICGSDLNYWNSQS